MKMINNSLYIGLFVANQMNRESDFNKILIVC